MDSRHTKTTRDALLTPLRSKTRPFHAVSESHSSMQRATSRLVLSVYTSKTCCLCDPIKFVSKRVAESVPDCQYKEIDINEPGHECFKEKYEYDIPVIEINKKKVWGATLKEQKLKEGQLRKIVQSHLE